MQLSIIVPAYNEGHRIATSVQAITAFCERELEEWEILVVDDGSHDDTASTVAGMKGARCLRNEINRGKGFSVRRGMLEARLDPVLFSDADLSTPIEEALRLHAEIAAGSDVAIASRQRTAGCEVRRAPHRKLMAVVFRLFVKAIALGGFHDTQCGFKMFRLQSAREIFSRQRIERWGFDVEVLYLARRLGYRISEVPVSWYESNESRLKLTTPIAMIGDLLRIRAHQLAGHYQLRTNPETGKVG